MLFIEVQLSISFDKKNLDEKVKELQFGTLE